MNESQQQQSESWDGSFPKYEVKNPVIGYANAPIARGLAGAGATGLSLASIDSPSRSPEIGQSAWHYLLGLGDAPIEPSEVREVLLQELQRLQHAARIAIFMREIEAIQGRLALVLSHLARLDRGDRPAREPEPQTTSVPRRQLALSSRHYRT